jgi:hypothetical protein
MRDSELGKSSQPCVGTLTCGESLANMGSLKIWEHLVGGSRGLLSGPSGLLWVDVLELDELLDILLWVALLNISKACFFQVMEGRDCVGSKDIRRSYHRWYSLGDWTVGDRSSNFPNSFGSSWVPWIASDPY